jgi:glycosyltransferase involved in cell wall biosynthesis
MSDSPFFSFVIPTFNREKLIVRAIESCLGQDFTDFEIVVIDDMSTDGTVEIVRQYAEKDERIRLVCHPVNRGVCMARNTGADAARGTWLIFLDSDDEMIPGTLATMHQRAVQMKDDVGKMVFMCQTDDGLTTPDPPLRGETRDYEGYIRWIELSYGRACEALPVIRRDTFQQVRYEEIHLREDVYHLNFAQHYKVWFAPDVVRYYHQDAPNQLTKPKVDDALSLAPRVIPYLELLLASHGEALARLAPGYHHTMTTGLATQHLLCGHRLRGLRSLVASLRRKPLSPKLWAILASGLMGPQFIAWLRTTTNLPRQRFRDRLRNGPLAAAAPGEGV